MIPIALTIIAVAICLAAGVGMWRLLRGPTVADRILAFDMIVVTTTSIMGLLSLIWRTSLFLELILIFSMLGFLGTVALVKYLDQPRNRRENTRKP